MKVVRQPSCLPFPIRAHVVYSVPHEQSVGDKPLPRKALASLLALSTLAGVGALGGGLSLLERFVHRAFGLATMPACGLAGLALDTSLTAGTVLWDPPVGAPTWSTWSFAGDFWSNSTLVLR